MRDGKWPAVRMLEGGALAVYGHVSIMGDLARWAEPCDWEPYLDALGWGRPAPDACE